ncbi:MAG TPA: hypothetical protein VMU25_04530 [Candidatus Paceibacterota bacterium]|nr:hypothetical protein [Candidatus Paceibacterota bacterium]
MIALAFALLLVGFVRNSPAALAHSAASSLASASVAITAGVSPNPENTLAAQLTAKEAQLNEQQQSIDAQEKKVASLDMLGLYSLIASAILFVLVAMNFYMDWRRGRFAAAPRQLSVDLRTGR